MTIFETSFVITLYHKIIIPLLVKKTARKQIVNVVFLAMNPDMWRYGDVYRRLKSDDRFNPVVVTAMRINVSMEMQIAEQEAMVRFFAEQGIDVVCGYNTLKRKWIDLKSLRPDIVFYTQPYSGGIEKSFEFQHNFLSLHCYSPYSVQLSHLGWGWNNLLQNYCWKQYYINNCQVQFSRELSTIRGHNAVAVGYCLEEEYAELSKNFVVVNAAWGNDKRKRVIWAPHHSISNNETFKVSSFLEICDFMIQLRDEYVDRVVFAFKPHPMLKSKLYDIWGKTTTDAYYDNWSKSENSFDASGSYQALFAGSDAMIHCSGSFIVEYLYSGKPVQYVYSKTRNPPDIGEIGDAALAAHYSAYTERDIRDFLDTVVLAGQDAMAHVREDVARKYLKSSNGKTFSQNVYDDIVKGLWG